MDLITPARSWAETEKLEREIPASTDAHDHDHSHDQKPHPLHQRMSWPQTIVMFLSVMLPIAGLVMAIVLCWHRGWAALGWPELTMMLFMYALTGFGVTIGYHRLLTHRAFETPRALRLFFAVCGSIAGQGAVIRWCATHRRHHQSADHDGDPHSPYTHGNHALSPFLGMWHAHMGWLFYRDPQDTSGSVKDLLADPALVFIDRFYFGFILIGLLIPGAIVGLWTQSWHGVLSGIIWGGLARICLLQHATFSINSVCHVWGRRPYKTQDESANNWLFAVLALGEGWHNNHHAFPTSARQGLEWWQFDSSWIIIRTLKALGLVRNVRLPSAVALELKRKASIADVDIAAGH